VDNTPMYFADLDVDMLLGLDFLVRHRAVVDLAKHEVQFGNQIIRARLVVDGTTGTSVAQVSVIGRTRIPPQSSTFTVGRLDQDLDTDCFSTSL
jgi:hypothetical protein